MFRRLLNPLVATMRTIEQRNIAIGSQLSAAQVLSPAPAFQGQAVVDNGFKAISLDDFKGRYLIMLFYPLDFTFVCPTELIAFSDKIGEFEAINTSIVGVSVDSHYSHLAWSQQPRKAGGLGGLKFPLLSDFSKAISRDYGVLVDGAGCSLRGLFIIDPQGVVRHVTVNDFPIGRSVDEAMRIVKALQFVEKHGEVCPANWTPDRPSMKGDPEGAKEYFESVN